MIKVYVELNYFIIEEPGDNPPSQDGRSSVVVTPMNLNPGQEKFLIESPKIGNREFLLSDLNDKAGTPYDITTWTQFYRENTTFSPALGSNGAIKIVGFWDADANVPDLSALTLNSGEAYQVTVAGNTNLNGQTNWGVYDLAMWNDSLPGNWSKIDSTDDVLSVNGKKGAVVLDKTDIGLDQVDNTSDADKPISTATQNALDGKENSIAAGTANDYWRGDKTFQPLNKSAVGLGNVENLKVNLAGANAPTVTDDAAAGYAIGSRWFFGGNEYVCVDATNGAAEWLETTLGGTFRNPLVAILNTPNTNDWNPAGFGPDVDALIIVGGGINSRLTGLVSTGFRNGQPLAIVNHKTAPAWVRLRPEIAASVASNRFAVDGNVTIQTNQYFTIRRSDQIDRWIGPIN